MTSAAKRTLSLNQQSSFKRPASDNYIDQRRDSHVSRYIAAITTIPTDDTTTEDASIHVPNDTTNDSSTHDEIHETVSEFSLPNNDDDAMDNAQQQQFVQQQQQQQFVQQQPAMVPAATIENMTATIAALQSQLAAMQANVATHGNNGIPAINNAGHVTKRRTTVDQKFDGKRDNYRAWKSLVLMNAEADATYWDTVFAKIVWIRGLLESDAANTMRAWMDTYNENRLGNTLPDGYDAWNDLWATLDKYYANQFDEARRIADYHRVKQGSRPHIDYYNEWEQKRVAAGINGSAESLLSDYMRGMNAKLRDYMQGFVALERRTWEGHIGLISRMAEDWEAYHSYSSSSNGNNGNRSGNRYGRGNNSRNNDELTTSQGGNAMDIDKPSALWAGKRAKYVSIEEIDRRRQNRLCLRCGGAGHRIAQCPLLPAMPPMNNNNSRVAAGRVIEVPDGAWMDDNSNGNEQTKE